VRRGTAAHRRAHLPVEGDPGCCTCGLPLAARNDRHLTELPPTDPDVAAAEARRTGERDR
jgi:hypothetical protein